MHKNGLIIFTIYKQPKDYPNGWSVRRFTVDAEGAQPDLIPAYAETLEQARTMIPVGLVRMPRNKDDDPSVYESWV